MLQSNLVATAETQPHEITWHYFDSIDPDSVEAEAIHLSKGRGRATLDGSFVRNMEVGDSVVLWARARFPGWENHVKVAAVRVFWAV